MASVAQIWNSVLHSVMSRVLLPLLITLLRFEYFRRMFYFIFNECMMWFTKDTKGWTVTNHGFAFNKEIQDPTFLDIYRHAGTEGDNAPEALKDEKSLSQRLGLQLYHYIITSTAKLRGGLEAKDVVEIGCGRGGGSAYMAKIFEMNSYVGVDTSTQHVHFCRRRHRNFNLSFVPGRAEALPLKDSCCDVVMCIESGHEFAKFEAFLDESWRILRPDGYLTYCDFVSAEKAESLPDLFLSHGFVPSFNADITGNVLASLNAMGEQRVQALKDSVPSWFIDSLTRYFAVPGTDMYEDLRKGKLAYVTYILQKKGN